MITVHGAIDKKKKNRPCYGYLHYSESRDLKSSFMDVSFQSYLKI